MDQIINWLLLVIIFVFDPLAIALVVAANFAFERIRPKKDPLTYGETLPQTPEIKIIETPVPVEIDKLTPVEIERIVPTVDYGIIDTMLPKDTPLEVYGDQQPTKLGKKFINKMDKKRVSINPQI